MLVQDRFTIRIGIFDPGNFPDKLRTAFEDLNLGRLLRIVPKAQDGIFGLSLSIPHQSNKQKKKWRYKLSHIHLNDVLISLNTDRFEIVLHLVEKLTKKNSTVAVEFEGFSLVFLPEKALWIKELSTLLIADLHFGKAAHFRKSGIPIPEPIHEIDLLKLRTLHQTLRPTHTYFLGDLFHSDWNEQWESLNAFLTELKATQFHLIKGNHDVLSPTAYQQSILKIHKQPYALESFILSHEPLGEVFSGMLNLCGHIHPGVRLVGKARQSVRIPCFYQSGAQLILPAFGNFTGLALVEPKANDKVWGITGEKIIPILSGNSIG